jgi:hypothetical protein
MCCTAMFPLSTSDFEKKTFTLPHVTKKTGSFGVARSDEI